SMLCMCLVRRPRCVPASALFPYTTLFRSAANTGNLLRCIGRSRSGRNLSTPSLQKRKSKGARHDHLSRRVSQTFGAEVGKPHRRWEEHTSELQSLRHLVCRLLLEKKTEKP